MLRHLIESYLIIFPLNLFQMDFNVTINASSIPYLDREVLEDFSTMKFYSIDHEAVAINCLMLAALKSNVISGLADDKEYEIFTEFNLEELEALSDFLCSGEYNESELSDVLHTLGIDLTPFFEKSEKPVSVKKEDIVKGDIFPIKEEEYSDEYNDNEAMDDEGDEEDVDWKAEIDDFSDDDLYPDSMQSEIVGIQSKTLQDLSELPEDFVLPKPLDYYKRKPVKPYDESKVKFRKPGVAFYCGVCDKSFSSQYRLDYHHFKIHEDRLKCPLCPHMNKIDAEPYFRLHMYNHTKTSVICVQCGRHYPKKGRYNTHKKTNGPHHDDQCAQCPERFSSFDDHKAHVESVHGTWMYKCGFCKELFKKESEVKIHIGVVHKGTRKRPIGRDMNPKVCPLCGKSYRRLQRHMIGVHEKRDLKLPCPHCDKTARDPYTLKKHIEWHHVKDPCPDCGKILSRADLRRHSKQWHEAERAFKCTHCPKSFTNSKALRDHINTHTGEKPYKCKYCTACFASHGTHATHQKRHFGFKRPPKKKKNKPEPND